jgi:hypothetical protein
MIPTVLADKTFKKIKMSTLFSALFESTTFTNTDGIGGAWDTIQSSWTNVTTKAHSGTHSAKAVVSTTNRILQKNIAFNTSKQVLLDYWCLASTVVGAPVAGMITGPVETVQPLSMDSGHFYYYDTTEKYLPVDTTYIANTWYHVQVYLDFLHGRVTWFINGINKGSATLRCADTGTLVSPAISLTALKFYNGSAGTAILYIDDLIVKQSI